MKSSKLTSFIFRYILLVILLVLFIFPVYWMVVSSFQNNTQLMSFPPKFFGQNGTLQNYVHILSQSKFIGYFKNSVIVSFCSVLLSMVVSVFAGYAFSRYELPFKNILMASILNIQIFPVTVIIISLFTFYTKLHLLNTYRGLILADIIYTLPFTVWFLKSFFDTIPKSIDEAAKIDGCGRLKVLQAVILPLIKPGLIAIAIYTFLYSWDDFVFALTIMRTESMKTLPLGIVQSFMGEYVHDYAGMMTLSVISSIPVVAAFLFTQKHMIAGLTSGAVKG
ncbi:MAG TPA: carbohydrate ABC transporter permease [Candidatus Treponema faecavium]|nr:carbohydrate ABC transporter permease [Candidatus Treponema faecavium]